jgi:hypothetical protein
MSTYVYACPSRSQAPPFFFYLRELYYLLWYHVVCEGRSGAVLTPLFALAPPVALPQDHITKASVAQPA